MYILTPSQMSFVTLPINFQQVLDNASIPEVFQFVENLYNPSRKRKANIQGSDLFEETCFMNNPGLPSTRKILKCENFSLMFTTDFVIPPDARGALGIRYHIVTTIMKQDIVRYDLLSALLKKYNKSPYDGLMAFKLIQTCQNKHLADPRFMEIVMEHTGNSVALKHTFRSRYFDFLENKAFDLMERLIVDPRIDWSDVPIVPWVIT